MESAFGIEHGEVSKGVPKGLLRAAAKMPQGRAGAPLAGVNSTANPRHTFLAERLAAHTKGREAAQYASVPKQYRNQGLPQHHLLNQTRSSGSSSRYRATQAIGRVTPAAHVAPQIKPKKPFEFTSRRKAA